MINKIKKSPLVIGLMTTLVIILIFVIYRMINLSKEKSQEDILSNLQPTQPVKITVNALGRIEPKDQVIKLSGPSHLFTGRIIQLNVEEGDIVNRGDVIAILDNFSRQKAAQNNARSRVRVAQAQLNQVKAGNSKTSEVLAQQAVIANLQADFKSQIEINQTRLTRLQKELIRQRQQQNAAVAQLVAQLDNDKIECWRFETLLEDGAVTVSQRDSKCLQEDVTQERLRETRASNSKNIESLQEQINETQAVLRQISSTYPARIAEARFQLERLVEIRPVDVQVAQAQLEQTFSQLEEADADLELTYIKAPSRGKILKIHTFAGESIGNDGILDLGQIDEMYVIAEVYETDISQIKIGQTASVYSNALPNQLQGKVEQIALSVGKQDVLNTDPTLDLDARVFEVKILLDPASREEASKFINLQVEVEILIDE